jgi:hypothetical protein
MVITKWVIAIGFVAMALYAFHNLLTIIFKIMGLP